MIFESEKGLRIAKIINKNNDKDNELVYVYDKDSMCCKNCSEDCGVGDSDVCCNSCNNILIHKNHIKQKQNKFKNIKEIKLPENYKFQLMPSNLPFQSRSLEYITAPAGAGKSFFVSNYLIEFKKCFKNCKVYMISRKNKDILLDEHIDKRINPDDMVDADLRADDFKSEKGKINLVIFDDVDSCPSDKKHNVKGAVYKLMDDIIEIGRSLGIYCVVTSHIPANGASESKRIINGCTSLTLFLNCINMNAMYLLEKHLGLSKNEIKKIKKLDGRTVTIIKSIHPHIILSEKECYMVKND